MKINIYTESIKGLGLGHVVRCVNLALKFISNGYEVSIFIRGGGDFKSFLDSQNLDMLGEKLHVLALQWEEISGAFMLSSDICVIDSYGVSDFSRFIEHCGIVLILDDDGRHEGLLRHENVYLLNQNGYYKERMFGDSVLSCHVETCKNTLQERNISKENQDIKDSSATSQNDNTSVMSKSAPHFMLSESEISQPKQNIFQNTTNLAHIHKDRIFCGIEYVILNETFNIESNIKKYDFFVCLGGEDLGDMSYEIFTYLSSINASAAIIIGANYKGKLLDNISFVELNATPKCNIETQNSVMPKATPHVMLNTPPLRHVERNIPVMSKSAPHVMLSDSETSSGAKTLNSTQNSEPKESQNLSHSSNMTDYSRAEQRANIEIFHSISQRQIAELISLSKSCIVSGGGIVFEALHLCDNVSVINLADNQDIQIEMLLKEGYIREIKMPFSIESFTKTRCANIGTLCDSMILSLLLASINEGIKTCKKHKDYQNGRFLARNFCNLDSDSVKRILDYRNHDFVRLNMYGNSNIDLQTHLNFIQSLNNDDSARYFLVQLCAFMELDSKDSSPLAQNDEMSQNDKERHVEVCKNILREQNISKENQDIKDFSASLANDKTTYNDVKIQNDTAFIISKATPHVMLNTPPLRRVERNIPVMSKSAPHVMLSGSETSLDFKKIKENQNQYSQKDIEKETQHQDSINNNFLDSKQNMEFQQNLKENNIYKMQGNKKERLDLGVISLTRINLKHRHAYLGIYKNPLLKMRCGRELMDMIEYIAFEKYALNMLYLEVRECNKHAIRLYEECGFVYMGMLKQAFLNDKKIYEDILIYGKQHILK